ncbi:MAG: 3'(2'),5'-bisphosphate nucleotidase CysQ [Deltaproteobacteria bacterium]|nr:3'(2'),5'-bisphosphate nucleotidase CysQ [Deltaproteobacteria bacterium]
MLKTATELALEAGALVMDYLKEPIKKTFKEDKSPVTEADLASDHLIRQGLLRAFPDHGFLTEEDGLSGNQSSPYIWVVDPLDGTKAFAAGVPGFCVMIGLLKEKQPYLGVVYDPLEDHLYTAIKGQGTFHRHQKKEARLFVSKRRNFTKMPLIISTGFPPQALQNLLDALGSPLVDPINSMGIKTGLLMRQVGDLYLNHHPVHYWDTCAPKILLEEAGGVMTHLDASGLSYPLGEETSHRWPTFSSNGQRHQEVLDLCRNLKL